MKQEANEWSPDARCVKLTQHDNEEGEMGLIWDLIQHGQINEQRNRAESLEQRVERLERELMRTNDTLIQTLRALEKRFGEDLDGDGRVG
jgi:hypothetical protein